MLLDEFLADDCTPDVRELIEERLANGPSVLVHFEFNRFIITVDREQAVVVIEDDLDTEPSGTQRVSLAEFTNALGRRTAEWSSSRAAR